MVVVDEQCPVDQCAVKLDKESMSFDIVRIPRVNLKLIPEVFFLLFLLFLFVLFYDCLCFFLPSQNFELSHIRYPAPTPATTYRTINSKNNFNRFRTSKMKITRPTTEQTSIAGTSY